MPTTERCADKITQYQGELTPQEHICVDNFPYRSLLGALYYHSMNTRPAIDSVCRGPLVIWCEKSHSSYLYVNGTPAAKCAWHCSNGHQIQWECPRYACLHGCGLGWRYTHAQIHNGIHSHCGGRTCSVAVQATDNKVNILHAK